MKKFYFSRKAILRAIRAACAALYFAAVAAAHAQMATGDGSGNVTITGSGSTQYVFSPASTPPLNAGGTLTIAPGANISVTSGSGSALYTIQVGTVATTTNSGYIAAINNNNFAGGNAFALTYTPVGTAGDVTVQNTATGTITASSYMQNATAVDIQNVSLGSVSITNNGLMQASAATFVGAGDPFTLSGVYAQDTLASGSITLANTGTISAAGDANNAYGAFLVTSGSGGITVTNSGTITAGATQGEGSLTAGLDLNSTGSGIISVTNSGSISGSGDVFGTVAGILAQAPGTAAISITNTGSVSGYNNADNQNASGIDAGTAGSGSLTINNSGTITASSPNGSGIGINAFTSGTGAVTITNNGPVTASGYNAAFGIAAGGSGTGSISITNNSAGVINSSAGNGTSYGIVVNESTGNDVTIANTATLTVSNPNSASGIYVKTVAGNSSVTNSGAMTFSGSGAGNGIDVQGAGNITIMNNAGGTIMAPTEEALTGIYAFSSGGAANVTNAAAISGASNANAFGIDAQGTSTTITNSGAISVTAPGFGAAEAIIGVSTSGPLTVNNSGALTSGSAVYGSYGIFLGTPGTVINSGNITAATDAILVQNGSSVTLEGRPIINGTIQGNGVSVSTSQLTFALSIASTNLAAAKSQLDTEIATYAAQDGGDYTFNVDGLTYDVSNFEFDGVFDDLMVGAAARVYANTPGYQSEGTVLDNLNTNNAQAAAILNALGNVPDSGVAAALAELSPKELEVFRNVAFDNNTFSDQQINNHLANLRDGLTGFDSSALTVQDSGMDPTLNQVRDHLLAYNPASTPGLISDSADSFLGAFDTKDMKSAQVNTMPVDRWSTFIAGNVILANLSNNSNLQDSNYTTGNVSAGLDYRLDEHFTVGALFAYAHTDADLDDRGSSATVDSYSPGIYASYVDGPWYGNFLGAYTRNAYTEDREIDIPGLGGDNHGGTSGNQGSANLTGGYEFQQGAFKFGPVASLQYVHLSIESIQEQGPTALDINSQNQDSLRSLLGFEGRFNARVGAVSVTPHVSASWQHEYMDNGGGITSQFDGAGGGSFVTQTDSPDRDSAFVDVGLDATVSKNVTVFVDYEAQAGQSNFFAQSAQGGVRIGF